VREFESFLDAIIQDSLSEISAMNKEKKKIFRKMRREIREHCYESIEDSLKTMT
jgi:hypothetical protein